MIDHTEVTPAQMARLNTYWSEIAGELITADILGSAFIASCTELAALRLEHKYHHRPRAKALYSANYRSWVFNLDRGIREHCTHAQSKCLTCAQIVANDDSLQTEMADLSLRETLWRLTLETIASGNCADPTEVAHGALYEPDWKGPGTAA